MTYHTLVQFDPDAQAWGIEFGDFDFETVQAELEDYVDHETDRDLLRILTTADESNAAIEAAIAELAPLKAFTFEASDFIPRGVHVTIYAADYAAAMAEAKRRVEEDEIDWDQQQSWDNGCTATRITGMWEGQEAYDGPDIQTPEDLVELHKAIAHQVAPLALESLVAKVSAYNEALNAREAVPTADDYNALLGIILGDV